MRTGIGSEGWFSQGQSSGAMVRLGKFQNLWPNQGEVKRFKSGDIEYFGIPCPIEGKTILKWS